MASTSGARMTFQLIPVRFQLSVVSSLHQSNSPVSPQRHGGFPAVDPHFLMHHDLTPAAATRNESAEGGCLHWAGAVPHGASTIGYVSLGGALGGRDEASPASTSTRRHPVASITAARAPTSLAQARLLGVFGPEYSCKDAQAVGLADSWYYVDAERGASTVAANRLQTSS